MAIQSENSKVEIVQSTQTHTDKYRRTATEKKLKQDKKHTAYF